MPQVRVMSHRSMQAQPRPAIQAVAECTDAAYHNSNSLGLETLPMSLARAHAIGTEHTLYMLEALAVFQPVRSWLKANAE